MAYHGKYRTPKELMDDDDLGRDEKIAMLEDWLADKHALLRASEEGMPGDGRSDLAKQIENALVSLKEGTA